MSLPTDAPLEAWHPDTQRSVGGLMQMAGLDVANEFRIRGISDHVWLCCSVDFPAFPEYRGVVTRCLTHPRGYLMFDVLFDDPVPPLIGGGYVRPLGWERLLDVQECCGHRFASGELLVLTTHTTKQLEARWQARNSH